MRSQKILFALLAISVVTLSACSWLGDKPKVPLAGKREPVLLAPAADALQLETGAAPLEITLPDALPNTIWAQSFGYPSHNPVHLPLSGGLTKRLWDKSVGAGVDKKNPLMSAPLIVENVIFAVDTRGRVTAMQADKSKTLWQENTRAKEQDKDELSAGGGIAYGRGQILATNGSRDLVALNAQTGAELWRLSLDAPLRGAPSVAAGRAYVTDAANHVVAVDAQTGKKLWSFDGTAQEIALLGTPAPALDDRQAIAALSNGTITSIGLVDGQSLWTGRFNISGGGADLSSLKDVAGVPVIDNGRVMAVNAAGYVVAYDAASGARMWQKDLGGTGGLWPAGNVVYVMTRDGISARSASDGAPVWNASLVQFEDKDKEEPIAWYGPYLLSGKLYAFGSAGKAVVLDPFTGKQEAILDIADNLAAAPAIAGDMAVMVNASGKLSVWK